MKKQWIKRLVSMLIALILIVPIVQADEIIYKKEINEAISQIDRLRKQFIAIGETGYINHLEKRSNEEQSKLVKAYLPQLASVKSNLEELKEQDIDKFQQRNVRTLINVILYLEDMSESLKDYLLSSNLGEQFKHVTILIQLNDFILDVVGTVKEGI